MEERLKPFEHLPPEGFWGKAKFQLRLLLDFQVRTVYHDLTSILPQVKGKVLDIGCGQSPYKHLLNPAATEYLGLDIDTASHFGYGDTEVLHFDGEHVPLNDSSVDHIICTEVLEHVKDPKLLVKEFYRVLKPGGSAVVTIPWSARMHYLPYDYHRFTSFALKDLFQEFSCAITSRGTDITVIISKMIILFMRNFRKPDNFLIGFLHLLLILLFLPLMAVCVLIGHLSLLLAWGSPDDPLGWTVSLKKE